MNKTISELNNKFERALRLRGLVFKPDDAQEQPLFSDMAVENKMFDGALVNNILEEITGVPALHPSYVSFSDTFLEHATQLIPKKTALEETVFPIKHEGNFVHLVMRLPQDQTTLRKMEYLTGSIIKPYCCHGPGIIEAINTFYQGDSTVGDSLNVEILGENSLRAINNLRSNQAEMIDIINHVSTIQLLRETLNKLVEYGASDVHFEPLKNNFRIRARKDGVMQKAWTLPSGVGLALIHRLKLISGMDLSRVTLPQDGSINYNLVAKGDIDIRTSSLPSLYGEKIVLRILDKGRKHPELADIGFSKRDFQVIHQAIHRPGGLVIVTGPTGSGKTTTLYSILNHINGEHLNIVTAEDPVEYKIDGVTQVSCTDRGELTFNVALTSFLRQDPDIIMIGEIRDHETANISIKASITGHQVLTTLHTNDAASAVNRLLNMNIPSYLVASAQITVVAQRLIRRVCDKCKTEYSPDAEILKMLGIDCENRPYYQGKGCEACHGTGYNGRLGVFEVLSVTGAMNEMILDHSSSDRLKQMAIREGMTPLRDAAIVLMKQGVTTVDEVLRITMDV